MSIVDHPAFNRALTDLAIGTHKHLPNDEIFLVEVVDAYVAAAVRVERDKWMDTVQPICSISTGGGRSGLYYTVSYCELCEKQGTKENRTLINHAEWCPAKETNSGNSDYSPA